jgi:UDP-glucose 4-epimerase
VGNFLVTGGAGFIGSKLSKSLINDGHKVYIIDNLSTGYISNVPKEAVFLEASVYSNEIFKFSNIKFDAIYHIAGQSSGEVSFEDPVYDLRTNTESTLLLLELAKKCNCSRFIYASTMSVYGKQPNRAITEKEPPVPTSFYGVGKLASEHYLRIHEDNGINTTCLRLYNVYGPGQNLKNMQQGMVSIFLSFMLQNKPIHIKGSKDRFRDFIYIDDVVDAFIEVYDNKNSYGEIFNVATGVKTTIESLVKELIKSFGFSPDEYEYYFEGSTPGDQFGIYASINHIKSKTSWSPKYQLSEGLKEMVKWAKELK